MFKLAQKYVVDRLITKSGYFRYTPKSLYLVKGENNQI